MASWWRLPHLRAFKVGILCHVAETADQETNAKKE
jgi:hypothetical protein